MFFLANFVAVSFYDFAIMDLGNFNLSEYGHNLLSILNIEAGIGRLTKVATYPDGKLSDNLKPDFDAICEFVVFNECIRRPFFQILGNSLYGRLGSLYSVLAANNAESPSALTYGETFGMFLLIGQKRVRDILDAYKKCTSSTYNGILEAVKQKDFNAFKTVLDGADCQDLMIMLWELRHDVWGDVSIGLNDTHRDWNYYNQRIKGADFSRFFKSVDIPHEELFIQNCVKRFFHIPVKWGRWLRDGVYDEENDSSKLNSITSIANGRFYHEWLDKFSKLYLDKTSFNRYLTDINNRAESIIRAGNELSYRIIRDTIYSHREDICERLKIQSQSVSDEDEYCDDIIYDKDILGDYIMVYTSQMLAILREVKDALSDDDKSVLGWLLYLSKYTGFFMEHTKGDDVNLLETAPIKENESSCFDESKEENPKNAPRTSLPEDIYDRKRLHNEAVINITCQLLQDWFIGANIGDIEFLFFGKGKSYQTTYKLKTTAKKLCAFIKYYIGTKNIKTETWAYFAERIYKNGNRVFPKPEQASGYSKPKEQSGFEENFRNTIREKLKNGLTKEQEEDIK